MSTFLLYEAASNPAFLSWKRGPWLRDSTVSAVIACTQRLPAQSASEYWMEHELNRDISVGFLPFPVKCQTKLWELSCHWGILLAGVSEWKSILRSRKAKPVSQVFTQISWSLGEFLDRATVRLSFFALQNNQKSVALLFGNRIQFALNFHLKSTKEARHGDNLSEASFFALFRAEACRIWWTFIAWSWLTWNFWTTAFLPNAWSPPWCLECWFM